VKKYQAKRELDDAEQRGGREPGGGGDRNVEAVVDARQRRSDTTDHQQPVINADGVTPLFGGDAVSARLSGG